MSSLPYSLPLCTPKNHTTIAFSNSSSSSSPLLIKNLSKVAQHSQPQDLASSLQVISGKCQKLVGRREALLATGLLSAGTLGGAQLATASEEGSCEFTIAPSGLGFCDKVIGIGPQASQGQLIKAHYVGRLEEDGKVFDSSYNRGKPLTFRVGVGEVIKGWDQGILGAEGIPPMLAGGKRRLKIPPELGYGIRGAGCRGGSCIIPPNSVLLFDVEFIGKA